MLKVNRTAFRYEPVRLPDEDEVRAEIIEKVSNYGRVGYRKVTHMLRNDGRKINHKRVERIWREAEVLARRWKDYYNTVRPHGSLGGRPPAPQSILLTA